MTFATLFGSRWFRSLRRGSRRQCALRMAPVASDALETRVVPATAYLLTTTNQLASFDTANPTAPPTIVSVSGLSGGENLLGIDIRPRDGKIYGLSDAGKFYTLNPNSGVATKVSDGVVTGFPFSTTACGVDFNPVPDRLR